MANRKELLDIDLIGKPATKSDSSAKQGQVRVSFYLISIIIKLLTLPYRC
jgi:hypothetical protein